MVEDGKTCTVKVIIAQDAFMLISKWLFFGLFRMEHKFESIRNPGIAFFYVQYSYSDKYAHLTITVFWQLYPSSNVIYNGNIQGILD